MQLTVLIACLVASAAGTETIGYVTRDYFGDIFTLGDCEPGSCDRESRRAAQIPGERCRCQCAPSHYTFREDMRQCIKDVGECPVAMFVRPFAVERIPLVFLPMTGQLVYPGAHLTVSGITHWASSKHLSCNVKSSLLMTSHGWQPIRTPSHIFGVYYDGNKTFLQWLGDDDERRRLQHHLVLIRLTCEGETSNGTFEPCAALRIGWAPGLNAEIAEPMSSKNNYVIIGLCLGILGLIYVGAVLIYLKVRKRRRTMSREGFAPSHMTIESNDEEEGTSAQMRSAYINNLVQEAELTSQKTTGKISEAFPFVLFYATLSPLVGSFLLTCVFELGSILLLMEQNLKALHGGVLLPSGCVSGGSDSHHRSVPSSSGPSSAGNLTNNPLFDTQSSEDHADFPTQAPPQEFFLRIRGMISAAKNRLNSFRYRPTLLVIPEDDYFYQDFKDRDMDVTTGERKPLSGKLSSRSTKMESIHGSNLGAAMLESKLAAPEPPPRSVKSKNKKRAPSPPGKHGVYSTTVLAKVHNTEDSLISSSPNGEKISKFDLFRLDLYDKINRIRQGTRDSRSEGEEEDITVLDVVDAKDLKDLDLIRNLTNKEESQTTLSERYSKQSNKISRKQMLYKLQTEESFDRKSPSEELEEERPRSHPVADEDNELDEEEEQKDSDGWATMYAGNIVENERGNHQTFISTSRPVTAASSNDSLCASVSEYSSHSQKGSQNSIPRKDGGRLDRKTDKQSPKRTQPDDDLRSEVASLSGDSLNSSFRKPAKSPSSVKSKRSRRSVGNDDEEDMSVISCSTMVSSSTAIKELEGMECDYDDDDEDEYDETIDVEGSQLSTDIDPDIEPTDLSLDESEHPSLEEYLQLSTQVAKKLSERTVPVFHGNSQREKNVISQFMREFKTTIGRLRSADEGKPKVVRTSSPGTDNWTLKKEEKSKSVKVTRKVSLFKRNPLKSRKHSDDGYLVHGSDSRRKFNGYCEVNVGASETEDTASCISERSSLSGGRGKIKCKTPEIIPAGKMLGGAEKTVIAITSEEIQPGRMNNRIPMTKTASINGHSTPKVSKAVTPPLLPPKPSAEHLKSKAVILRNGEQNSKDTQNSSRLNPSPLTNSVSKNQIITQAEKRTSKSSARRVRTPSIDSDSISVANSDMTEDSLNTSTYKEDRDEDDDVEEDDGPIDRCLAQLADSVIQPPDDCSLNRYLSQLGTVLATREDSILDQCLNKLASNMNGSRATKGFNVSQHLPLGTWEHVCVDWGGSERSTPTSDRSSTSRSSSRGSQEHLRKKSHMRLKHHHHKKLNECSHVSEKAVPELLPEVLRENQTDGHVTTNRLQALSSGGNSYTTCIHVERSGSKQSNVSGRSRNSNYSEDERSRASSLSSTRDLQTPVSETTSDPSSLDLERPKKRRPAGKRAKKVLNGTCRQHIQNSRLGKECAKKTELKQHQRSSDVTVIQLEGEPNDHVTKVESSNTFVTLINVDSSDCSNSAEEK